ncbi:hypothetical protein QTP88_011509 [Uroleucon formosanum]
MATVRFLSVERKFQRDESLRDAYVTFMKDYEATDHMKEDQLMEKIIINETFISYINVDENLEICGEWTENDIISDILDEDDEEVFEDQQIQSTITKFVK